MKTESGRRARREYIAEKQGDANVAANANSLVRDDKTRTVANALRLDGEKDAFGVYRNILNDNEKQRQERRQRFFGTQIGNRLKPNFIELKLLNSDTDNQVDYFTKDGKRPEGGKPVTRAQWKEYILSLSPEEQKNFVSQNSGVLVPSLTGGADGFTDKDFIKAENEYNRVLNAAAAMRNAEEVVGKRGGAILWDRRTRHARENSAIPFWLRANGGKGAHVIKQEDFDKTQAKIDREEAERLNAEMGREAAERERLAQELKVLQLHNQVVNPQGNTPADMPTVTPPAQSPNNMPVINTPAEQTAKMPVVPDNSRTNISSRVTQDRQQQEQQQGFGRQTNPAVSPSSAMSGITPQAEASIRKSVSDFGKQAWNSLEERWQRLPAFPKKLGAYDPVAAPLRSFADILPQAINYASWPVGKVNESAGDYVRDMGKKTSELLDKYVFDPNDPDKQSIATDIASIPGSIAAFVAGGKGIGKAFSAFGKSKTAGTFAGAVGTGAVMNAGGNEEYSREVRGRSQTPGEFLSSNIAGSIEGLPIFSGLTRPARKGLRGRATKAARTAAGESAQEMVTQVANNAILDRPLGDDVLYSGGLGAIGGAGFGAVVRGPSPQKPDVQARRGGFGSKPFQPGSLDYLTPQENTSITEQREKQSQKKKPKATTKRAKRTPRMKVVKPRPAPAQRPEIGKEANDYYGFEGATQLRKSIRRAEAEGDYSKLDVISTVNNVAGDLLELEADLQLNAGDKYNDHLKEQLLHIGNGGTVTDTGGREMVLTPDQIDKAVNFYISEGMGGEASSPETLFSDAVDFATEKKKNDGGGIEQEKIVRKAEPKIASGVATMEEIREAIKGDQFKDWKNPRAERIQKQIDLLADRFFGEKNADRFHKIKDKVANAQDKEKRVEMEKIIRAVEEGTLSLAPMRDRKDLSQVVDGMAEEILEVIERKFDADTSLDPYSLMNTMRGIGKLYEKGEVDTTEKQETRNELFGRAIWKGAIGAVMPYGENATKFKAFAEQERKRMAPFVEKLNFWYGNLQSGRTTTEREKGEKNPKVSIDLFMSVDSLLTGDMDRTLYHELGHALENLLDEKTLRAVARYVDPLPFPKRLSQEGYSKHTTRRKGFTTYQSEKFVELLSEFSARRNEGREVVRNAEGKKSRLPEPIRKFFEKVLEFYHRAKDYIRRNILNGEMSEREFNALLEKAYTGELYKEAVAKRPIEEILSEVLQGINSVELNAVMADTRDEVTTLPFDFDDGLLSREASALNTSIFRSPSGEKSMSSANKGVIILGTKAKGNIVDDTPGLSKESIVALDHMARITWKRWDGDKSDVDQQAFTDAITDLGLGLTITELSTPARKAFFKWQESQPRMAKDFLNVSKEANHLRKAIAKKLAKTKTPLERSKKIDEIRAGDPSIWYEYRKAFHNALKLYHDQGDNLARSFGMQIGFVEMSADNPDMPHALNHALTRNNVFHPFNWYSFLSVMDGENMRPLYIDGFVPMAEWWRRGRVDDLDTVLSAIRALDNPQGVGKSANVLINKVFHPPDAEGNREAREEFKPFVDTYKTMMNAILKMRFDVGLMDEKTYEIYRNRRGIFFPDVKVGPYSPEKRRTQSTRKRVSNIEALSRYIALTNSWIQFNLVARKVAEASGRYGFTQMLQKDPTDLDKTSDTFTQRDLFMIREDVNSVVGFERSKEVDLTAEQRGMLDIERDILTTIHRQLRDKGKKDKIIFYKNGKARMYHIHDNEMMQVVSSLGPDNFDAILDWGLRYPRKLHEFTILTNPYFAYWAWGRDVANRPVQGAGIPGKEDLQRFDERTEHLLRAAGLPSGRLSYYKALDVWRGNPGIPAEYLIAKGRAEGKAMRWMRWREHLDKVQGHQMRRAAKRFRDEGKTPEEAVELATRAIMPLGRRRFRMSLLNFIASAAPFFSPSSLGAGAFFGKLGKLRRQKNLKPLERSWGYRIKWGTAILSIGSYLLGIALELLETEEEDPWTSSSSTSLRIPIPGTKQSINLPSAWENQIFLMNPLTQLGRFTVNQESEKAWLIVELLAYAFTNLLPGGSGPYRAALDLGINEKSSGAPVVPSHEKGVPPSKLKRKRNILSHDIARAAEVIGLPIHPNQVHTAIDSIATLPSKQVHIVYDKIYNLTADVGVSRNVLGSFPFYSDRTVKAKERRAWRLYSEANVISNQLRMADKDIAFGTTGERQAALMERERIMEDPKFIFKVGRAVYLSPAFRSLNMIEDIAIRQDSLTELKSLLLNPILMGNLPSAANTRQKRDAEKSLSVHRRWIYEAVRDKKIELVLELYDRFKKEKGKR